MLYSNDSYQTNKDDFNEINNNFANSDFVKLSNFNNNQGQNNTENKLSKKTCLLMFIIGFAYTGLLLISFFVVLIFSSFQMEESLQQILTEVVTYVILFSLLGYLAFKSKKYFIDNLKNPKNYLYGVLIGAAVIVAEIIISTLISSIYQPETNANQTMVNDLTTNYPTLMIITTVIIGPICEELTYRVGLYELLRQKNEVFGFIVSGLIFAFVHIGFTDTTFLTEITAFPVYLTIAYLFNLAYKKYGLAGSVTAHAITNLVSMLAILLV